MTTPIQKVVYELDKAGFLAKPNGAQAIQDARDIIKRELEKAAGQATASTHGSSDFVKGWNAHHKAMGLE